ncbi:Uncharacterised protein [Yersinia pseudotuberculosis]|nr:Uncharacterised protein [Yersinia pseudotuberculosis]
MESYTLKELSPQVHGEKAWLLQIYPLDIGHQLIK